MSSIFSITFIENGIYLTPCIPLSFEGEGEEILERGFAPLLLTLPLPLTREGVRGIGW